MASKLRDWDLIKTGGMKTPPPNNNEFTFHLSDFDNQANDLKDLHCLLKDETALSFATMLLEMSGELEVACNDGMYSLVDIFPFCENEESENLEEDRSEDLNISNTFVLQTEIMKDHVKIKQFIRATMELSTEMKSEGNHSVRIRIRFSDIEKIPSAVVYFTVVSLTRVSENWKHFISNVNQFDDPWLKRKYTMLLQTSSRSIDEDKRRVAAYMLNKINKTIERGDTSDEHFEQLTKRGLVPSSAKLLQNSLLSGNLEPIEYDDINVETIISHNVEIHHVQAMDIIDSFRDLTTSLPIKTGNANALEAISHNTPSSSRIANIVEKRSTSDSALEPSCDSSEMVKFEDASNKDVDTDTNDNPFTIPRSKVSANDSDASSNGSDDATFVNANCLSLQPTRIGKKCENMGHEQFDRSLLAEFAISEDASYILQETQKQLKRRYPSVYDDTNQSLITFPAQYNFGVGTKNDDKARAMQYGCEDQIQQRIEQLKKLPKQVVEDKRELKHLTEILKKKQPLSWESNVVLRMRNYFAKEPGLCLHNYKTQDYLIRYVELGKELRKMITPKALAPLERAILKILGKDPLGIDRWVKESMEKIDNEIKNTTSQQTHLKIFYGKTIQSALKLNNSCKSSRKKTRLNELKKAFPIFETTWDEKQNRMIEVIDQQGSKIERRYTRVEIIHKLYKVEYEQSVQKFNLEFDCLVLLAKHRLILDIEAKHLEDKNSKNIDLKTRDAAKQVKRREEYIRRTFGHLLAKGWRYVPIVAFDVSTTFDVKYRCTHCSSFVLTNGSAEEQLREMDNLMDALTSKTTPSKSKSSRQDFQHLFSRFIGLSGLFMAVQKVSSYHKIMGSHAKSINGGWTQGSALKFGTDKDGPRFGDIIGRPHDIYQLIFFNPDQIGLLALEHKTVVFLDDYGAGKSLILKEASIRMSKRFSEEENHQNKKRVFYISLLAADRKGRPRNDYFTFDIMSKIDLENTEVKVLDVHDLVEEYKRHHNGKIGKDITVYKLVDDLVDHNPDDSFFVDECPFEADNGDCYTEASIKKAQAFIEGCRRKANGAIWFAFQANALNDSCKANNDFDEKFKEMKENLVNNGVFIRSLNTNMRNTSEVGQVTKKAQFDYPYSSYAKLTKNVQSLEARKQTSSTHKPTLIPYLKNERGKYMQKAIQLALEKNKEEADATVFMFDETEIRMEEIKNILISCGEDPNKIVLHPEKSKKETTQQLEDFLKNPQGIYLVPQDCFTGTEARSVIFLLSETKAYYPTSVRCHLSRAISNLIVIQELVINELQTNYLLPSMEMEESFLRCSKETKIHAFKCPAHESKHATTTTTKERRHGQPKINSSFSPVQEDLFLCKPCWIVCHQHCEERTAENIGYGETKSCSCCSMTNCLLQK